MVLAATLLAPSAEAQNAPPATDAPPKAVVGDGFHLFDKQYVLLGFNWQQPCQANAFEFEVSYVPHVSEGLWWVGAYVAAGFQTPDFEEHRPPSEESSCFAADRAASGERQEPDPVTYDTSDTKTRWYRFSGGGEIGWRMLGLDVGLLYNSMLREALDPDDLAKRWRVPLGVRFRAGLVLSDEVFTGKNARYGTQCCKGRKKSVVPCECERTPVGASLFLYYGNELYITDSGVWDDGMLGISAKIGFGIL